MSCKDVCVVMDYGYDSNEFYTEGERRARKVHKCCECGVAIAPGETYQRATGKSGGEIFSVKTCLICAEIRKAFCCDGWIFGDLWESLRDQLFPHWDDMMAIDCLARLTTDAAIARMRAEYADFRGEVPSRGEGEKPCT